MIRPPFGALAAWAVVAAALAVGGLPAPPAGAGAVAGAPATESPTTRLPAELDRRLGAALSPGPLAVAHGGIEGVSRCTDCHTWLGGTPDERCVACHEPVAERMTRGLGFHGSFEGACRDCHGDHRGPEADLLGLDRDAFAHDQAQFTLRGAHADVACDDCHVRAHPETGREAFHALGIEHGACRDCHEDPHAERLVRERACDACHVDASWHVTVALDPASGLGFDHDADTRFPLDALHAPVACRSCHEPEAAKPPPRDCGGCHRDAVALLAGRFGGMRVAPDPHHERTSCAECHPARVSSAALTTAASVCTECHPAAYASLLATQRAVLDEALVAARLRKPQGAERALLEDLARSGLHHAELAEALARRIAGGTAP